jgi:hypothetical protein
VNIIHPSKAGQEQSVKNKIWVRLSFVLIPVLILSIACGSGSLIPEMPTFPPIPPSPSMNNVQTGSSPLSGDWNADTEFGRIAFSVDPEGGVVTTAVIEVTNWTCGGTTLTAELQSISQWPISNGNFAGMVNLNGSFHTIRIDGSYDEVNKKFSGTWEQNAHGTLCSNTWESAARE